MSKELNYIVATSKNWAIGKDNKIPWHYREDFKYFKEVTTGHSIIMGRKTIESIGKPLPNRKNIILTNNKEFKAEGCLVFFDRDSALKEAYKEDSAPFVIGGEQIYNLYSDLVTKIYHTFIDLYVEGDTFFTILETHPGIKNQWKKVLSKQSEINKELFFDVYEKS